MARKHYFQWLLNQEGQPITGASIFIYLADTSITVKLYTSETGSDIKETGPQITTNQNGYFEFWLGDANDTNGYERSQKFKIRWDRSGVETGEINNVSIFDTDILEVDETDSGTTGSSLYRNKLISNYLARKWNTMSGITVNSDIYSANYTITDTDLMETLFLSGSNITVLPTASIKRNVKFGKFDGTTTATISAASGDLIEGAVTTTLTTQYDNVTLESDGISAWYKF